MKTDRDELVKRRAQAQTAFENAIAQLNHWRGQLVLLDDLLTEDPPAPEPAEGEDYARNPV